MLLFLLAEGPLEANKHAQFLAPKTSIIAKLDFPRHDSGEVHPVRKRPANRADANQPASRLQYLRRVYQYVPGVR